MPDLQLETSRPSLLCYHSSAVGQPWKDRLLVSRMTASRELQENLTYTVRLYSGDRDRAQEVLGSKIKRQPTESELLNIRTGF